MDVLRVLYPEAVSRVQGDDVDVLETCRITLAVTLATAMGCGHDRVRIMRPVKCRGPRINRAQALCSLNHAWHHPGAWSLCTSVLGFRALVLNRAGRWSDPCIRWPASIAATRSEPWSLIHSPQSATLLQVAVLAAGFLQQLLGKFQRLLFSSALLAALGEQLAAEDRHFPLTAHLSKAGKLSDIAAMLVKVSQLPHSIDSAH